MPFKVTLHADTVLTANAKRRYGGVISAPIATVDVVMNGNLANANIYSDNSVEISIPLETCAKANYILLHFGDPVSTIIAGEITDLGYTNDNNTVVSYAIDHFTSAQETNVVRPGFMADVRGLCARTNLVYPQESTANMIPEPITGNDFKQLHGELTGMFNTSVNSFTGCNQGGGDIFSDGYVLVLWITGFAGGCLASLFGGLTHWERDRTLPPEPTIKTYTELMNPNQSQVQLHYGAYSKGVPLVFTSVENMSKFINNMLNTKGMRVELNDSHFDGVSVSDFQYADIENSYFTSSGKTEYDQTLPLQQIKVITEDDILKIQILPDQFAKNVKTQLVTDEVISTGLDLTNFNPMWDEKTVILPDGTIVYDYSKAKAFLYPYYYHKIETAIGNSIDLLPQLKYDINTYLVVSDYKIKWRFVGGESPKVMIGIGDYSDPIWSETSPESGIEWISVIEYPTMPWVIGVNSEQQIGALQAKMHKTATIQNAIIGDSTKGTGFLYGLRGGKANASQQGGLRSLMTSFGGLFSGGQDKYGSRHMSPWVDANITGGAARGDNPLNQEINTGNAERITTSGGNAIIGEGIFESLLSPHIKIFRCGYSDGELFAFCRYLDRRGQATNAIINPITNAGVVFGNNASITSYAGRTWYEFHDLNVNGTMPTEFKNAIHNLFVGGVYLVN